MHPRVFLLKYCIPRGRGTYALAAAIVVFAVFTYWALVPGAIPRVGSAELGAGMHRVLTNEGKLKVLPLPNHGVPTR